MSSKLASSISVSFFNPSDKEKFFENELVYIRDFEYRRENIRTALNSCDTNLFMGFFFGGTGNNFENYLIRQDYSYFNVARLYSAHPRLGVRRYVITPTFMAKDMT